jgi:AspT/YidE/YbjL antiporter-like protein
MEQTILRGIPQAQAIRYQRDEYVRTVTDTDACREGDLIVLVGASPKLPDLGTVFIGPTVRMTTDDPLVEDLPVRFETVTVNATEFTDDRVELEDIENTYGIEVRGWWRGREYFAAKPTARWRPGDRLRVLGTSDRVKQFRVVAEKSGRGENEEIDLLRFSVGAVVAVFIGGLALPVGPYVRLSLGVTGGALFAGLMFGRSARIQIPRGAAFFLKELGLGLFLAGVGMSVGKQGPIAAADLVLVPGVLAVITIPAVLAAFLLRRAHLIGPYVEGGVSGAITSTPALIVATRMDETSEPATTYAGIYLFALLTSVAVAQILVVFG